MPGVDEAEFAKLREERDLFWRLLRLGFQEELEPFLREALSLMVSVTGAQQGYIEIRDSDEEGAGWSMGHGWSPAELEGVRGSISRGIIAAALSGGETIATSSAVLDERFRDQESVQRGRIEAVLCAPIGDQAARGVVYLQGRHAPEPFSEEDRQRAELMASHLAPIAGRLLSRRRESLSRDATTELRRRYDLAGVIGRSQALATALEQAMLAAPLDVSVLLTGESGTGKTQLARIIHEHSQRRSFPFVELNCSTLPASLVESELFGALAGSHSEARRDRSGKVAAAERGTLFLDEVTELPLEAQAKLLQLLQGKCFYPLGATAPVNANVRVIAATNRDLEEAVRARAFREDLFYRLHVLPIRLPSLAERREDLPDLARFLCARACERHALPRLQLSPGALAAIGAAAWPGNVRQLENAIEVGAIRAAGTYAQQIERRHLFSGSPTASAGDQRTATFQEATQAFQRDLLASVLDETDWNVAECARRLDLARSHVYSLIKAFGLKRGER